MSNIITPNPVSDLNQQPSGNRDGLYIRRSRNIILVPGGFGAVTGAPSWGGGFAMDNAYFGLDYEMDWVLPLATTPITFSVVSGSLPPGLVLSGVGQAGGRITGRATALGVFNFTLRAANFVAFQDQTFQITVFSNPVAGFV